LVIGFLVLLLGVGLATTVSADHWYSPGVYIIIGMETVFAIIRVILGMIGMAIDIGDGIDIAGGSNIKK
jgi:hypothetical protein